MGFILPQTFPLRTLISTESENEERNENNEIGKLWGGSLLHYVHFVHVDANEGNWLWCKKKKKKKTMYQPKAMYWKYFKHTETLTAIPYVKDIA